MSIHEKLLAIQSELKVPKGQYNSFGGYKYRSCEDIVEAVKPILAKHGCTLTMTDEIESVGDRFYVRAMVTLADVETEQMHSVIAFAREDKDKKGMDGSQITGAASSYARKYALNGLFAIDDTKDADATNTHGKDEKTKQVICTECGEVIKPYKNASGKTVSVEEHITASMNAFGQTMCQSCCLKKLAQQNTETIAERAEEKGVAVNRYDPGKSGF